MTAETQKLPQRRSPLAIPALYSGFQLMVGAARGRRDYLDNYVRPRPGDHVLDIGCGPADILDYLPPVDYLGIDISQKYVEAARARFGNRGRFLCAPVHEATVDVPGSYDLVLATGVVHHLDDTEALSLFRMARHALKPGGRLVTLDGCYMPGQSRIARWMLDWDRGRYVRRRDEYLALASQVFQQIECQMRHDMLRIPYTHLILQCSI